ncbi:MAG: hypothetical protein KBC95_02245 [Candidatus Peribacteraceae bacterium]|nr:hypothetical protein [Candidatus Peribacteraceae bacterium]
MAATTGTFKHSDGQKEVEWTWTLNGNFLIIRKQGAGLIESLGAEVLHAWLGEHEGWLVREYKTHPGQNEPMIVAILWPNTLAT